MDITQQVKITVCFTLTFFFSSFFISPFLLAEPSLKTIAITQIVDHPSANAVHDGILIALRDKGYEDGKNIILIDENARGSPVIASQIAQKFIALKPDLIIPITTPSTQAIVKTNERYGFPIVFAAVTDPVASGVVESLIHPGEFITGVTDAAPIKRQVAIFKQVLPQLKVLGVLYNPGDNSSSTPVKEVRKLAKEEGLTLIEATAFKTADVPAAMQQLVGKEVDAVFVPLDNTILSAMDAVVKISFQYKIRVVSSDSDSVRQGALVSSGYTHFDTGYRAGEIAAQVLEGANPGEIPVASAENLNIYINKESAKKLNISFSAEILKTAKEM